MGTAIAKRMNLAPSFDLARKALARANTIDEVKRVRDRAEALRQYVRVQGGSLTMQNDAAEIKLRAERRAGEILKAMEKNRGGGEKGVGRRGKNAVASRDGIPPTYADLGITRSDSSRWQAIAGIADGTFEAFVGETKEAGAELTERGAVRLAKTTLAAARDADLPSPTQTTDSLSRLVASGQKFGTIYADPPWQYGNQGTRAATHNHYQTMPLAEIAKLPVSDLAMENAHLHLWTTNAFLPEAFGIIAAWGFDYKSVFVWCKPQMGIGNYWRVSHEFLMFGVRGQAPFRNRSLMSWAELERSQHSRKPERVRAMLESASPAPRLELFGRRAVDSWTVWGNEVEPSLLVEPAEL